MTAAKRGFGSMDEDKHKEISSKGGQSDGGNFRQSKTRASMAGKRGAAAQSRADKARGGKNSHSNSAM